LDVFQKKTIAGVDNARVWNSFQGREPPEVEHFAFFSAFHQFNHNIPKGLFNKKRLIESVSLAINDSSFFYK